MEGKRMKTNRPVWILACILALTFALPGASSTEQEENQIEFVKDMMDISPEENFGLVDISLEDVPDLKSGDVKFKGKPSTDVHAGIDIPSYRVDGLVEPNTMVTRASDEEKEVDFHDYPNGSRIDNTGELISGSLTYDPAGTSDWVDWYKIAETAVNPAAGATLGPFNITIEMTSFLDGNDGHDDLYELRIVETSPDVFELESDYYDYVQVHVRYYDPSNGVMDMGGTEFLYDDLDSGDSWDHAGNWTYDFKTSVPSTGPEDLNGFQDGLDEVGWYYIRFDFGWMQKIGAPDRSGFSVHYEFDIQVNDQEITDDGSNTIETASTTSDGRGVLHSQFDHADWYKFEGNDAEKLWKFDFSIEKTWGAAGIVPDPEPATTGTLYDTWMDVWVVFPTSGEDEIWGNEDDSWYSGAHVAFTYFLSGDGIISDSLYYNFTVTNTGVENGDRGVYIGIFVKPVTATYDDTSITGYQYNFWNTFAKYQIHLLDLVEESVNQDPVVSDLRVTSDNTFYGTGGDVSNEFTFEVTYTDPDGDEPEFLDLYLDHGTSKEQMYSMLLVNDGNDVTDGRVYTLALDGDDIGDKDDHYSIMVNASDLILEGSLRTAIFTPHLYLNDTLLVWDDGEVKLGTQIDDIDPIDEDGGTIMVPMDSYNGGPFNDPERVLKGVMVWNSTEEAYSGDSSTGLLHINMTYRNGDGWYAAITPKTDMHGQEVVSFYGYDVHSHIIKNYTIEVYSVNDPPKITGFELEGDAIDIDVSDPLEVEVDLRSEGIKEDILFEFRIFAEDTDPEVDRTPITYEYLSSGPSSWSTTPSINRDTGIASFTPTNSDVRDNGWMKFRVSDGEAMIDIKVLIKVTNVPDDPVLNLEPKSISVMQGEEWYIYSTVFDIDKGDDHVFSINLDTEIVEDIDPIADQLPNVIMGTDLITSFDTGSGRFTLSPLTDNVWKGYNDELLEQVTLTIVIRVVDLAGRTDVKVVNVTLIKDGPWIPEVPDLDHTIPDDIAETIDVHEGLTVSFSADEYDPRYGTEWIYSWSFSDGAKMTGREVEHTFSSPGDKTARLTLVNGEYSTTVQTQSFNIPIATEPPEPPKDPKGSNTVLFVGIGFMILVIIIVIVFMVMRKKQAPVAQEEYDDPRHRSPSLSPGASRERLAPATSFGSGAEHLPPAKSEHPLPGVNCPSCGAPV